MIKIIGDVMLDSWIEGDCDRVSPEAPVIVLKEKTKDFNVGGAGNLALNLSNLGTDTWLYGAVGKDIAGHKIIEILLQNNISSRVCQDAEMTTTKTRMVGQNGQHLLRVDKELSYTKSTVEDELLKDLVDTDTVLISDYNKGVIQKDTVQKILTKCKNVYVDPKQGFSRYIGAFLVKPNMKEYVEWFGEFNYVDAKDYLKEYDWEWLVVTDGADGIHIVNSTDHWHCKEEVLEVADVSGAGDTVMAIIAHGLNKGKTVPDSCALACYGASRVVEKRGVTVVTKDDLNRGVVWTNGVFDILHTGHLKLLRHAATLGKKLIVGINSDNSVKRLKGETRPINDEFKRKEQLEQLGFIDEVVIFDGDTPIDEITKIRPDIIVKGGDYTVETVVGHKIARVEIFPIVEGYSTTETIEKLNEKI